MLGKKNFYCLIIIGILLCTGCDGEKKKAREEQRRIQMRDDYRDAEFENTIAAYEKFLKKYPKSIYVDGIAEKISILKDSADWYQAESTNTLEGYNGYRLKNPTGKYVSQARGCTNALLLEPEELSRRYGRIDSLLKKLKDTVKMPKGLEFPAGDQIEIILIPETKRLLYVQEVLFPDLRIGTANAPVRLYIAYNYRRGEALYWEYDFFQAKAATQAITGKYDVILEKDGVLYLKEKRTRYGGAGCTSFDNLIANAVGDFAYLDTLGDKVENTLRDMLSFAAGIPQYGVASINQRLFLLKHALGSQNWADRQQAVNNMGNYVDVRVRSFFLRQAHDSEPNMRRLAAEYIGNTRDSSAVDTLLTLLHDEKTSVRCSAIKALGLIGDKRTAESVAVFIKAPDRSTRRIAACALAGMNDNRGFDVLVSWMNDGSSDDRDLAVQYLGQLKDKKAVEPLVNCLKKTVILTEFGRDLLLIQQLCEALAEVGDTSAIEPLIKILKDNSELDDIVETLKKLTGKDFGASYEEWSRWWQNK